MEDNAQAKLRKTASAREAATQRGVALKRTAKWRNQNAAWPPPPIGQEAPRRVKPAPGLLQQVLACIGQFIGGLVLGYAVVGTSYNLMSPFLSKHIPSSKPQVSEMPAELVESALTLIIVIAIAAIFFRQSKVFAMSFAIGGILCVAASLAFLGM